MARKAKDTVETVSDRASEVVTQERRKRARLTRGQEKDLSSKTQKGDIEARNTLVTENMALVTYLATTAFVFDPDGVDDAIQAGYLGLIRAADSFKARKGAFAAYARHKILEEIRRYSECRYTTIRTPRRTLTDARKVAKAEAIFSKIHGRAPSIVELATMTDMTSERTRLAKAHTASSYISTDHPNAGYNWADSDEYKSATSVSIASEEQQQAETEAQDKAEQHVKALMDLACLSDTERLILKSHFGIGGLQLSEEEVAKEINTTRERVNRMRKIALEKMRVAGEEDY